MATARAADLDPMLGRVIDDRFTLQSVLGRGGMGVVYRAHQQSLERSVALKLMSGLDPARQEEFQRRFFLEASTVAKLKHPNTITVFDYGSCEIEGERSCYITMELVDGVTLSRLLSRSGPLPPLRAVHVALQICRSLQEAHAHGVVHRDLKPGNVMLVRQDADDVEGDFVKVLDFGLAKTRLDPGLDALTRAGSFLGSPRYVAPEQIEGRPVDNRADIYSFGCVFFRMLTGRVPFDGEHPVDIMRKHLQDEPPALNVPVPAVLERLVRSCLAKRASDRPRSMDEVIASLKLARGELQGQSTGVMQIPDAVRGRLDKKADALPPHMRVISQPTFPAANAPLIPKDATGAEAVDVVGRFPERSFEDSTRPTQLLPRRPLGALAAGAGLGLVLAAVVVVWRLSVLGGRDAQVDATTPAALATVARAPVSAALRITTNPAGADVLEVVDGTSRLLGVTPLVVRWQVHVGEGPRELRLRKTGYAQARAVVLPPPPPPDRREVWLDVEHQLQPEESPSH